MSFVSASTIMWKYVFVTLAFAQWIYAGPSNVGNARENEVNGDQGFAFSYSGASPYPVAFPLVFPRFPAFNFNPLFSDYFDNIRQFNEELAANYTNSNGPLSYSFSSTSGGGSASSSSSSLSSSKALKEGIGNNIKAASSFEVPSPDIVSRFGEGNGGAASATGFIGGGQVKQTASLYPENPGTPNINTRFGSSSGGDGSYGVFTSSFSETLPGKDGRPITRQKAQTTVNDNGKVTSYSVHNP